MCCLFTVETEFCFSSYSAGRALRGRGQELLLVPDETSDEMPIGAVGEFVEDDMLTTWSATRSSLRPKGRVRVGGRRTTPAGWRWSIQEGKGGQAGEPGKLRGRWLVCIDVCMGSDACVALRPSGRAVGTARGCRSLCGGAPLTPLVRRAREC